jgi:hypothetical protein
MPIIPFNNRYAYVAKTATYTATEADYTIDCTGTFTVTLPTAVGRTGRQFNIVNSGTGIITVNTTSSQTIAGQLIVVISTQYNSIIVESNGATWIIPTAYRMSEVPHATLLSNATITPASTTVAYPIPFEGTPDLLGMYRQAGAFTCNLASPATITWAAHKLSIGAAVQFSGLTGATGITAGTIYYIATTNFTTGAFELSTTFGGAGNVNTSATGSGTCTCVSRIYAYEPGDYLFNISAMVSTATNTDATFDIWFIQGNSTDNFPGTNIANSNTQIAFVTVAQMQVLAVAVIFDLLAGDYIRLDCRTGSNGNLSVINVAAGANPTRPAAPSIILTINKIGR